MQFRVPACEACGGVLKPAVTFFGDVVPQARKQAALGHATDCNGMLVVGTSLMVWSAYRLVVAAAAKEVPIAVLNLGDTRADREGLQHLKVEAPCGATLQRLADDLGC